MPDLVIKSGISVSVLYEEEWQAISIAYRKLHRYDGHASVAADVPVVDCRESFSDN